MMRRQLSRACGVALSQRRAQSDAQTILPVHTYEQFIRVENEDFIHGLLEQWKKDKASVDPSWHQILETLDEGTADPEIAMIKGFSRPKGGGVITEADEKRVDALKFAWMVRSFEQKGHLIADLDPLGIFDADLSPSVPPELSPSFFGFTETEMDKTFRITRDGSVIGSYTDGGTLVTLREVVSNLRKTYCGHIGYEFAHLRSVDEQAWLREQIIADLTPRMSKLELLNAVVFAEGFEKLLHTKFQTMKRFGSEGGEAVIPMLQILLDVLSEHGFENANFSMAHRGRLNILHNVLGKPMELILNEFKGLMTPDQANNLGDVKYHLGYRGAQKLHSGGMMNVRMSSNPSHLECAAPVSQGLTRAMQDTTGTGKTAHVVLHGDAAYSGQGVCFETTAMADLSKFGVGGTIHIISNNQVGFTTNPAQSRSAAYCSDLAKLNNVPVFHVNGDRPECVLRVAALAASYRATFNRDVIIDFVCYRRHGHNEMDQPRFTQPQMYSVIDKQHSVGTVYANALMAEGAVQQEQVGAMKKEADAYYREQWNTWEAKVEAGEYVPRVWVDPVPTPYEDSTRIQDLSATGVATDELQELGRHLAKYPEDFQPHPLIAPIVKKRFESYDLGKEIEWASAEQLALATLITEGHGVRISGQDVERGTFSQRHYNLHDSKTGNTYNSLMTIPGASYDQTPVLIGNSLLSEFAVAGFEMGYSTQRLDDLVMWEAQFGDFSNGAQIIWDNFLSGSEVKWGDKCNLVVSLPHGYDGQGPEHSSSRIERFLQLEGSDDVVPADFRKLGSPYHALEARTLNTNWQVCMTTMSSNYFHMLRRQLRRDFRKPLIHSFSKSNLRAAESKCDVAAFGAGTQFRPVIDQDHITKARRVVFCCGQVFNTLSRAQAKGNHDDVALVRVEQLAPFPWEQVADVMEKYSSANANVEFAWAQEEPRNFGCWPYVRPRLRNLRVELGDSLEKASNMRYIGRKANGSPATGYPFIHEAEEKAIIDQTFDQ